MTEPTKDRAQESEAVWAIRKLVQCTKDDPCAYDNSCKNHRQLSDLLCKESEQREVLVVEGCASFTTCPRCGNGEEPFQIDPVDVGGDGRLWVHQDKHNTGRVDCCWPTSLRTSHPSYTAILAEIERKAIEWIPCSCVKSRAPESLNTEEILRFECDRCIALKALQPKVDNPSLSVSLFEQKENPK